MAGRLRAAALAVPAILFVGCGAHYPSNLDASTGSGGTSGARGSTTGGGGGCGAVSWNHQIAPIVQAHCLQCHGDPAQFGAPHPLTTYGETQATSVTDPPVPVYQVMAQLVTSGAMPPSGTRPSADQVALIQQWAAAGAPEDACPGSDGGYLDAGAPVDAGTIDLTGANEINTADAFTVLPDAGIENNLYRCFTFNVHTEDGGARGLVKFAPVVDNSQILHHMILFHIASNDSPAGSYDCFGGPQGSDPQFMYGWAPGAGVFTFPQGVGFDVKDGDQFVLQIHYHNFTGTAQTDSSGVAMWWTDQPLAHSASVVRLGNESFSPLIPGEPDEVVSGTCTVPAGAPDLKLFAAMPHMHTHGTEISTVRLPADGGSDTIVDVKPWSFDNQHAYDVDLTIHGGDAIRTDCHYDTTSVSQPIPYGEATEDEMCYDFVFVYPTGAPLTIPDACMQ